MCRFAWIGVLAFCAQSATAGPWPRDKGEGFLSTSAEIRGFDMSGNTENLSQYSSLYMEYGLGRSLTIGLNVGHGPAVDTDIRAFVNLPIYKRGEQRIALELSAGKVGDTSYSGIGLQYGRGFQAWGRNGWVTLEGRVDAALGDGFAMNQRRQSKFDVTVGMTHPNGLKTLAQVFNTTVGHDVYTTFAPGLVVPIGRKMQIETGLLIDLNAVEPPGLKIGLWQKF